jgi:hypothetical protein
LNSRPWTFFGLLFIADCGESMMANFVVGKALATFSVALAMRKPTAITAVAVEAAFADDALKDGLRRRIGRASV